MSNKIVRSKTLHEIVRDWFTGPDGETWDPARMLWIAGIVAFLAFTGHEVYKSDKFDMMNFAMAYGTLLAAGAAGVKIKETTEPKAVSIDVPVEKDPSLKPPKG
jgi:hypothetical protein